MKSNKLGKDNEEEEVLGRRRPADAEVLERINIGIRSVVNI